MEWKKIPFRNLFIVAGIISIISALSILLVKGFLPPVVPLFYGKPIGVEQLSVNLSLLLIPSVSIVITLVNILIGKSVGDDFLQKSLAVSSLLISFMSFLTVVKIILLVGFF